MTIARLQQWFRDQCDGDWEHAYGITIETLDNPGWHLRVDLSDTSLSKVAYSAKQYGTDKEGDDWVSCQVSDGRWHGYGGPGKLDELIEEFLAWANR